MSDIVERARRDIQFGLKTKWEVVLEAEDTPGITPEELDAIRDIEEPETVELTEVFGGGENNENSNPDIEIKTIAEATRLLLEGKISGFDIGNTLGDEFSPNGRVRKWGTIPGQVQIKIVNARGQEGSGSYGHIEDVSQQQFLHTLVEQAMIDEKGINARWRSEKGLPALTLAERVPKFRAH